MGFAHGEACGGEEFEQAAATEEIEVGAVDVIRIAEAVAGLSRAGPAVIDAGDAAAVERGGGFGAGACADDALMEDAEEEIGGEGEPEPFGGEMLVVADPGEDQSGGDDG